MRHIARPHILSFKGVPTHSAPPTRVIFPDPDRRSRTPQAFSTTGKRSPALWIFPPTHHSPHNPALPSPQPIDRSNAHWGRRAGWTSFAAVVAAGFMAYHEARAPRLHSTIVGLLNTHTSGGPAAYEWSGYHRLPPMVTPLGNG